MIAGTKIRLTLLGIFLLGVVVGVVGDNLYRIEWGEHRDQQNRRGAGQPRSIDLLTQRLNLRPDQIKKVDAILTEAGEEYVRLRTQLRPQFDEVRNRQRDRIRALLDPQQKEAYTALIQEWEQHRRNPDRKPN